MGLVIAATVAAFLGVLMIVVGFYQARGGTSHTRLRMQALEAYSTPKAEGSVPMALHQQGSASAQRTKTDLERAGLALKLHEYIALRLLGGVLSFAIVFIIGSGRPLAFFVALGFGALGYLLPALYVRIRITRQQRKFSEQLEEMITMVSNSLRAGFGLLQAFDMAAEQLQPPISTELGRLLRDIHIGAGLEDALEAMSERVGSYDLEVFITAILIQRSAGSNLSEVLEKVAHTIRERVRLKGEINTLTAQKKLSAWLVGLMPPAIILIIMAMNFEYMEPLFTTDIGRLLLATALILDIAGMISLRRITSIEI
jgi:tight adherence protein B